MPQTPGPALRSSLPPLSIIQYLDPWCHHVREYIQCSILVYHKRKGSEPCSPPKPRNLPTYLPIRHFPSKCSTPNSVLRTYTSRLSDEMKMEITLVPQGAHCPTALMSTPSIIIASLVPVTRHPSSVIRPRHRINIASHRITSHHITSHVPRTRGGMSAFTHIRGRI